jgi:osmotically-inducible protein OsmY
VRAKRLLALLALPAAALAVQGCVPVAAIGVAGTAAVIMGDRRSSGVQIEDQGIELAASARIGERYADKARVNVTSFNRSVLLTGQVPDAAAKAEVERIVLAVQNVRRVTNELEVATPSASASRSNDSFISGKVQGRFLDAGRFNPIHFKVVTEAGVVYLMGLVTEQEAADAIEIARTTAGVRKVVIIFEYCQPTDEICRPEPKPLSDQPKRKGA